MHDEIIRFSREGEIRDDSDFIRLKKTLTLDLHNEMRDCGYVPVLDLSVHWSTSFCPDKKRYTFKISAYGVYVGGENCGRKGMTEGKIINTG